MRTRVAVLMILLASVGLACLGIAYTNYALNRADERWCATFGFVNRSESSIPKTLPKAEYDRQVAALRAFGKLKADLGCKDG